MLRTASVHMNDDDIERPVELMRRAGRMQRQTEAVDDQTEVDGVWVVGSVKTDVKSPVT
jgi:hypothetical protein